MSCDRLQRNYLLAPVALGLMSLGSAIFWSPNPSAVIEAGDKGKVQLAGSWRCS